MEFTLKRKYILGLGNWLQTLSLQGQESRNRTKFVEELSNELKEVDLMRLEIIKKYASKEENGDLVMIENSDGSKHYDIPEDKMEEFQKEFAEYLESDFEMGGAGTKTRLEIVKDIVLNTTEKIDPKIASDYDAWCDAFEFMKEE